MKLTFDMVRNNDKIRKYIGQQDTTLRALGYTEHSFGHVALVGKGAKEILLTIGRDPHEAELAEIAGYLHDIGNIVNRVNHSTAGATIAFTLLEQLGGDPGDIATVVSAIGNHDEHSGYPVNDVSAAIILADKSDVRRSRVLERDPAKFDIHDRVNYAVEKASYYISEDKSTYILNIEIDTKLSPVMDYFEIFLNRMLFCRKAAQALGLQFQLIINNNVML